MCNIGVTFITLFLFSFLTYATGKKDEGWFVPKEGKYLTNKKDLDLWQPFLKSDGTYVYYPKYPFKEFQQLKKQPPFLPKQGIKCIHTQTHKPEPKVVEKITGSKQNIINIGNKGHVSAVQTNLNAVVQRPPPAHRPPPPPRPQPSPPPASAHISPPNKAKRPTAVQKLPLKKPQIPQKPPLTPQRSPNKSRQPVSVPKSPPKKFKKPASASKLPPKKPLIPQKPPPVPQRSPKKPRQPASVSKSPPKKPKKASKLPPKRPPIPQKPPPVPQRSPQIPKQPQQHKKPELASKPKPSRGTNSKKPNKHQCICPCSKTKHPYFGHLGKPSQEKPKGETNKIPDHSSYHHGSRGKRYEIPHRKPYHKESRGERYNSPHDKNHNDPSLL